MSDDTACAYCGRVMPTEQLCKPESRCKDCCECEMEVEDHQGDWR